MHDQFWDDAFPEMPYTAAAEDVRGEEPVIGAAEGIKVREEGSSPFEVLKHTCLAHGTNALLTHLMRTTRSHPSKDFGVLACFSDQ